MWKMETGPDGRPIWRGADSVVNTNYVQLLKVASPRARPHGAAVADIAMVRAAYLFVGLLSMLLGAIGLFVPLLPTVPFIILAAFCFARSSTRLEQWLVGHQTFGPHILAWRSRGAISRAGKRAAIAAFAASVAVGFAMLDVPWSLVPAAVALVGGSWILSRPTA